MPEDNIALLTIELSRQAQSHNKDIEALKEKHESVIASMKKEHSKVVGGLQTQCSEGKNSEARIKSILSVTESKLTDALHKISQKKDDDAERIVEEALNLIKD